MPSIRTSVLEIFYEDTGRRDGPPVLANVSRLHDKVSKPKEHL